VPVVLLFVFFLIALILFVPVLLDFAKTGTVPRFPTLIVSGFVALAGVLSFYAGVILSTLVEKERQEFEFRLVLTDQIYKKQKEDEK
jgi:hypothetical protein